MAITLDNSWERFLEFMKNRCSPTEFQNWFSPIKLIEGKADLVKIEVPNIFVKEYLIDNYKGDLLSFLPHKNGEPLIEFVISETKTTFAPKKVEEEEESSFNRQYTFENFIEGPSNQFVKSAAMGVALRPGRSFNPLFIHGGVGLGKTHLLHGIGHFVKKNHKNITVRCITTETFINEVVHGLQTKSLDQLKRFYRNLDVLLVDDIQFLQNRANFEEEFCNTFEALINQHKQVVITSDKPPSELKLSERMVARMEWGLVAHVDTPELETRIAILQHKAQQRGLNLPSDVSFFVGERIYGNVRQLEGAINRLFAYSRLVKVDITREIAENALQGMLQASTKEKTSIENILKAVSAVYEIKMADLKGEARTKNIAFARQVAMYLAKELLDDSLTNIASSFGGKTHSTLIHAWKKIKEALKTNDTLNRQIQLIRKQLN